MLRRPVEPAPDQRTSSGRSACLERANNGRREIEGFWLTWIKSGRPFPLDKMRALDEITDLSTEDSAISNTLTLQNLKKFSGSMIKQSIRRRIVAIAVGLIILMVATSVLSMVMVGRVGHLLDELTARYIPANAHLTRINILSLERALALRRMVIAKMQEPPDEIGYRSQRQLTMRRTPKSTARRRLRASSSMRSLTTPVRPRTMPRWRASKAGSTA